MSQGGPRARCPFLKFMLSPNITDFGGPANVLKYAYGVQWNVQSSRRQRFSFHFPILNQCHFFHSFVVTVACAFALVNNTVMFKHYYIQCHHGATDWQQDGENHCSSSKGLQEAMIDSFRRSKQPDSACLSYVSSDWIA